MQNLKLIPIALRRILTLKRCLLLALFGTLTGIAMAKAFPAGAPWYAGVLYAVSSFVCVGLTLWLSPVESK